jgi:hypothetical protein
MSFTIMRPVFTILCAGVLLLSGCGGERIERCPVRGSVRLDGQPLAEGTILFSPRAQGPSAGGEIRDGVFTLSEQEGPSPGPYLVEINAYRPTGKTERDAATGETITLAESIIPPRYNRNSTLTVEVKAGEENRFEFELQSKR